MKQLKYFQQQYILLLLLSQLYLCQNLLFGKFCAVQIPRGQNRVQNIIKSYKKLSFCYFINFTLELSNLKLLGYTLLNQIYSQKQQHYIIFILLNIFIIVKSKKQYKYFENYKIYLSKLIKININNTVNKKKYIQITIIIVQQSYQQVFNTIFNRIILYQQLFLKILLQKLASKYNYKNIIFLVWYQLQASKYQKIIILVQLQKQNCRKYAFQENKG
eukprot:TRINITY_DN10892_c0_g2_i1.p1 TRINITY_DN10892_c0_g2~~TRINITY_DN10892_c0_g2_i1.p1  ORF type:complete len:244 (+),score=-23.35 TRINITY_DN10892_c0_g2_i1:84-734(+)